jgi:hypothetical protein
VNPREDPLTRLGDAEIDSRSRARVPGCPTTLSLHTVLKWQRSGDLPMTRASGPSTTNLPWKYVCNRAIRTRCPVLDPVDVESLCGLIFREMSQEDLDNPEYRVYNTPESLHAVKHIIEHDDAGVIPPGSVVSTVNGSRLTSLDELMDAFERSPELTIAVIGPTAELKVTYSQAEELTKQRENIKRTRVCSPRMLALLSKTR